MNYSIFDLNFILMLIIVITFFSVSANGIGLFVREKLSLNFRGTFFSGALFYLAINALVSIGFALLKLPFNWYLIIFVILNIGLGIFSLYILKSTKLKINVTRWIKENYLVILGIIAIAMVFLMNDVYTYGHSSFVSTFMDDEYYRNLIAFTNMGTNIGLIDPRTGLETGASAVYTLTGYYNVLAAIVVLFKSNTIMVWTALYPILVTMFFAFGFKGIFDLLFPKSKYNQYLLIPFFGLGIYSGIRFVLGESLKMFFMPTIPTAAMSGMLISAIVYILKQDSPLKTIVLSICTILASAFFHTLVAAMALFGVVVILAFKYVITKNKEYLIFGIILFGTLIIGGLVSFTLNYGFYPETPINEYINIVSEFGMSLGDLTAYLPLIVVGIVAILVPKLKILRNNKFALMVMVMILIFIILGYLPLFRDLMAMMFSFGFRRFTAAMIFGFSIITSGILINRYLIPFAINLKFAKLILPILFILGGCIFVAIMMFGNIDITTPNFKVTSLNNRIHPLLVELEEKLPENSILLTSRNFEVIDGASNKLVPTYINSINPEHIILGIDGEHGFQDNMFDEEELEIYNKGTNALYYDENISEKEANKFIELIEKIGVTHVLLQENSDLKFMADTLSKVVTLDHEDFDFGLDLYSVNNTNNDVNIANNTNTVINNYNEKLSTEMPLYFSGEVFYLNTQENGVMSLEKGGETFTTTESHYRGNGINFTNLDNGTYNLLLDGENFVTNENLETYGFTRNGTSKKIEIIPSPKDTKVVISEVTEKPTFDVVLDPGHGGIDPGASGAGSNENILMLELANIIKPILEENGLKVGMTRTTTEEGLATGSCESANIEGRTDRINNVMKYQAPLAISLHFDAGSHNDSYIIGTSQHNEYSDMESAYSKHIGNLNLFDSVYSTQATMESHGSCGATVDNESETDWYYLTREFGGYHTGGYQTNVNGIPIKVHPYAPVPYLFELFNGVNYDSNWFNENKTQLGTAVANTIIEYIN